MDVLETANAVPLVVVAVLWVVWPLRQQARLAAAVGQPASHWRGRAVVLSSVVVLGAGGLYGLLGNPGAIAGVDVEAGISPALSSAPPANVDQVQIEAMVARLAQRLAAQPDDADGWRMLARSYDNLGRFREAVGAYQQLIQRRPNDPDVLTDYAVSLGMAQGQTLSGEPEALLARALMIKPDHVQALALSGSAAFERHDYDAAIRQWDKLLSMVPPGDEVRQTIEQNINKARALKQGSGTGGTR